MCIGRSGHPALPRHSHIHVHRNTVLTPPSAQAIPLAAEQLNPTPTLHAGYLRSLTATGLEIRLIPAPESAKPYNFFLTAKVRCTQRFSWQNLYFLCVLRVIAVSQYP
jgi:hypothetical protein